MGLLDYMMPGCRHGDHGPMEQIQGRDTNMFALVEVNKLGLIGSVNGMVVRAYRCKVCNYIELRDIPQAEFDQLIASQYGANTN